MADDVQRDSKTPKAPLNIPAGNSPISPDNSASFNPAEERLTGDFWSDRIKALKVGLHLEGLPLAYRARVLRRSGC